MKLTDKERNTCAALLCRWAAQDNELMASDLYGSSQYYKLLGALTALRTLGLMAETVLSERTRARRVLQLWQDHAGRHGVRRTGTEGGNGK